MTDSRNIKDILLVCIVMMNAYFFINIVIIITSLAL